MHMWIQKRLVGVFSSGVITVGVLASITGSAGAAPMAIDQSAFSGSETVITFDGFPNFTPLTTQYAADGVTFSGGLVTSNQTGLAQNFTPTIPASPVTIDFSETMLRAGFHVVTASTDDLVVALSAYSGDVLISTGTLTFATGQTMSFVGIQDDVDGIDRMVLSAVGGAAGTFRMDNLRFEPVPEPSTAFLLATGLVALTCCRARRRGSA